MSSVRYLPLQEEEIRAGKNNGLSEEQLSLFADHRFNNLQMHVIRSALESGMPADTAACFAHPWIKAADMEEIVKELEKGEVPKIPAKPFPLCRVLIGISVSIAVLAMGAALILMPHEEATLMLAEDEVTIPCGSTFDPSVYVKTTGEGNLILPESFVMNRPGSRLVVYRYETRGKTIEKLLRVTADDESSPRILLRSEEVVLERGQSFSCRVYLDRAYDDQDGDLTDQVSCSNQLSDDAEQEVVYSVRDTAGNTASNTLTVKIKDPPVPSPAAEPEVHLQEERVQLSTPTPSPVTGPVYKPAPPVQHEEEAEYEYVDQDVVVSENETVGGGQDSTWVDMN